MRCRGQVACSRRSIWQPAVLIRGADGSVRAFTGVNLSDGLTLGGNLSVWLSNGFALEAGAAFVPTALHGPGDKRLATRDYMSRFQPRPGAASRFQHDLVMTAGLDLMIAGRRTAARRARPDS